MPALPTVDDAFGDTAPVMLQNSPYPAAARPVQQELPTADEVFGSAAPNPIARADRAIQQATFRVFNAFGYSATEAFGDEPIATPANVLDKETEDQLRKWGIFNNYAKGQADFTRGMFEGLFKTTAAGLALTQRASEAAVAAPLGSIGQFLEEVGLVDRGQTLAGAATDPQIGPALQVALLGGFGDLRALTTEIRAGAARAANLHVDLGTARSAGVIAEGEAGFYDAKPLTPEHAQARVTAAEEAGAPPPLPEPPPADVHELARRIDPETFDRFDALEGEKTAHRATLHDLAAAREGLPEAVQAKNEIDTILSKVNGVEDRLTKKAAERLSDAHARLDAVLSMDTPEMAAARKALLDADIAQRDLVPQVSSAYRQAREIMPEDAKAAEVVQAASDGKPPQTMGLPPSAKEVPALEVAPEIGATPQGTAAPLSTGGQRVGPLRPVEGTGDIVASKLAEGMEAKAIEENLTHGFGDLQEHGQVNMAEQAQKTVEFMNKDYEAAKAVAMGEKAPPKGLLLASVMNGVEMRARAEGDIELIRALATESKATRQVTTMAQNIRTLGERDRASPVAAIQEVQAARAADLEARNANAVKDTVKEIKAAVKRAAPPRDVWASFIDSITCPE